LISALNILKGLSANITILRREICVVQRDDKRSSVEGSSINPSSEKTENPLIKKFIQNEDSKPSYKL